MTTHRKARKDGKARKMWAELPQIFTAIPQVFYQSPPRTRDPMPVAVLELSPSADAARIEAGARAMFVEDGNDIKAWPSSNSAATSLTRAHTRHRYLRLSRAHCAAIGALSTPGKKE